MHINSMEIMDLLSRTIIQKSTVGLPSSDWKVDVSALPAGIYYIKVSDLAQAPSKTGKTVNSDGK